MFVYPNNLIATVQAFSKNAHTPIDIFNLTQTEQLLKNLLNFVVDEFPHELLAKHLPSLLRISHLIKLLLLRDLLLDDFLQDFF